MTLALMRERAEASAAATARALPPIPLPPLPGEPGPHPLALDHPAVLAGMVGGFARGVLERLAACAAGAIDLDEAIGRADAIARTLAAALLGREVPAPFVATPWNRPEALGAHLVRALGMEIPPEQAVRALLLLLAPRLFEVAAAPLPEEGGGSARLVAETTELLCGRFPAEIAP